MRYADEIIPTQEELWQRVRALEAASARRARRDKLALALGGFALALVATVGAAGLVPDTLAAKSFRLVDATGAERAALVAADAGAVALTVYDSEGASTATLVLAGTQPLLSVIDASGRRFAAASSPTAQAPPPAREATGAAPTQKAAYVPAEEEDDSFDWSD